MSFLLVGRLHQVSLGLVEGLGGCLLGLGGGLEGVLRAEAPLLQVRQLHRHPLLLAPQAFQVLRAQPHQFDGVE